MKNVIIMGAAGRDFHNFNAYFKNNMNYRVVAFTATQIPDIEGRTYPIQLTGKHYPNGIPIYPESDIPFLIKNYHVDECVFSYSDVTYHHVMKLAAIVQANGADFRLLGPESTMIKTLKPVIAVCAARTGAGKSQTSRRLIDIFKQKKKKVIAVRHPMPYGNLKQQMVQRYAGIVDLKKNNCTVEEMEEYEPHINNGTVVYAGVDYHAILKKAEDDPNGCDVLLWDGGNNDMPFYRPDMLITVVDPLRVGHEMSYYPGEVNLRMAGVVVINKIDTASLEQVNALRKNVRELNPDAVIIEAASPVGIDETSVIAGKKVLVIEDGPTLTHGGMKFGAGTIAAKKYGVAEIVNPRDFAVGQIKEAFKKYPEIGNVLPAMGYGSEQLKDLEETISNTPCDAVIIATPIDLNRIIKIKKPCTRVHYKLQELGTPDLEDVVREFITKYIYPVENK